MLQITIFAALLLYVTVLLLAVAHVGAGKVAPGTRLGALLAQGFLFAQALFCLPLPIRSLFTLTPEGSVSPQIGLFAAYIPLALLYCSAFNVVFAMAFRSLQARKADPRPAEDGALGAVDWAAMGGILVLGFWMLAELASEAGGILGLILLGYRVTETFVGKGHYAVAFDWLTTLGLIALAEALRSRNGWAIASALPPIALLGGAYLVMGRRGSLVILGLACLYLFHVLYRPVTRAWLGVLLVSGFLVLNAVGLLRGSDYEDLGAALESAQGRSEQIQASGDASGLYYVLTTGQFAVPFETLPQVMRAFGDSYFPGFGLYVLQGLALIVPSGLWPDRPLPLANWYMARFYGVTELNEGRQFFFLTDAYMNFGPLGCALWGLLFAWFWWTMGRLATAGRSDPLASVGVALIAGNMLSLIAVDFPGFAVAFVKGFGFPLLVLWVIRLLRKQSRTERAT